MMNIFSVGFNTISNLCHPLSFYDYESIRVFPQYNTINYGYAKLHIFDDCSFYVQIDEYVFKCIRIISKQNKLVLYLSQTQPFSYDAKKLSQYKVDKQARAVPEKWTVLLHHIYSIVHIHRQNQT